MCRNEDTGHEKKKENRGDRRRGPRAIHNFDN